MTEPLYRKCKLPTHTKMPKLHLCFVVNISSLHESIRAQFIFKHALQADKKC